MRQRFIVIRLQIQRFAVVIAGVGAATLRVHNQAEQIERGGIRAVHDHAVAGGAKRVVETAGVGETLRAFEFRDALRTRIGGRRGDRCVTAFGMGR